MDFYRIILLNLILAVCLGGPGAIGQSNAASTSIRLALIAPEAALRPALDLLTVELSRDEKIILLERAEIERVLREQSLSATSPDYLKLGQLLGADGLLIANLSSENADEHVGLRLVAVKPGVVLGAMRSPWPVANLAEWSRGIPNHFSPLFPKLNVLAKDAVPLSVVNLRAAVSSRETRELEQQLTLLAIERLTRERELFVLERQRMELLTSEKELKSTNDSAFWSGSYLLDGVIDRDGFAKERVTLHAQLTPPRGGVPVQIEISGPRTNLAGVLDQLTARILTTLRMKSPDQPWNALAEAEKYLAEARWAYQWGMFAEAAAASEAGWALGGQTADVAAMRVRAYYENGIDRAQGHYDLSRKLVSFGPGVRPVPGEFPRSYDPPLGCGVPPDHTRFDRVRRAMSLYGQGFQQFIATNSNPGWEWHDLGIDLLEGASYWLRHFYYLPEGRVGVEAGIAEVQLLAREIASLIETHPAYTNDYGRGRYFTAKENWGWGFAPGIKAERDRATLLVTKATWGAYWFATPESGLGLYRGIVEHGQMPNVRRYLLNPDFCEISAGTKQGGTLPGRRVLCYLTGWKWPDRQRALAVWHRFVEELSASTNLTTQAEGLFLRCAHAPTDAQHAQYFRELLAFMEAHQEPLAVDGFSGGLAGDLGPLIESRRTGATAADAVLDDRGQMARRLQQAIADAKVRSAKSVILKEMKEYLAAGEFDFMKFNKLFFQFDYQPEDARSLLPAVEACQSNLTIKAELVAKRIAESQRGLLNATAEQQAKHFDLFFKNSGHVNYRNSLNFLEAQLKLKLNPPAVAPVSMAPGAISPTIPAPPLPGRPPMERGYPPGVPLSTNVLPVTRFWSLPERLPEAEEPSQLSIADWCYREGRLWVDARGMKLGGPAGRETYFNRAAIYSIEPGSLKSEAIALDPRRFSLPKRSLFEASPRGFDVHDGWLYVSSTDAIWRFSLKTQVWEDLGIPLQGHARIMFIGRRMILTTQDSVLAAALDGKAVQVLASNRRQPPVTLLDSLSAYDSAPVVLGPAGSLIIFVAGKLYELPADGKDWNLLSSAPAMPNTPPVLFEAGLVWSQRTAQNEQTFALRKGSRSPELLRSRATTDSRGPGMRFGSPGAPGSASAFPPGGQFRGGGDPRSEAICLEQDVLWVLSGAFGMSRGAPVAGRSGGLEVTLSCFVRGLTEPVSIPIRLQLPEAYMQMQRFGGLGGVARLESTPAALAVSLPQVSGFWLIPRTELAKWCDQLPPVKSTDAQNRNAP